MRKEDWPRRHGQSGWQLRWVPDASGIEGNGGWQMRDDTAAPWQATPVTIDYLGPWLIGLRLGRRRYWLWPDSASPEALHRLRRHLLGQMQASSPASQLK
ncbi:hypothetical protein [Litchfieldella xinjiangensis]|uniref:hypothetical protein n=1 Tax=Litchfieldella xinjiangensis TaxID=1166948 RepID=UPI0012E05D31|nr:hypothetical protein [Halomonas xinjiangensis]